MRKELWSRYSGQCVSNSAPVCLPLKVFKVCSVFDCPSIVIDGALKVIDPKNIFPHPALDAN